MPGTARNLCDDMVGSKASPICHTMGDIDAHLGPNYYHWKELTRASSQRVKVETLVVQEQRSKCG